MKSIKITEDCIIYNDMGYGWLKGKGQPAWHLSLYHRWYDMWTRCRNPESNNYENYKDCPIDERYHLLSNYVHDIELLDDFNLLKENPSKYHIDKDKIDPNNRCYFFEHLSIVTDSENSKERNQRCKTNIKNSKNKMKAIKGVHIISNEVIIFTSMLEAHHNGFNKGYIRECLQGKKEHYKKYRWEYIKKEEI